MKTEEIEKAIHDEFYDSGWYYMTHAGYDAEVDRKAFEIYRLKRLREFRRDMK